MFSGNAKNQIEACRNCWMCRHVCPVGLATGKESQTPRGRALLLFYLLKGLDIEKDLAEDMYACCLCNACADWCETGYEPAVFVREARRNALVGDFVPSKAAEIVECALKNGGIFTGELSGALSKKFSQLPKEGEILLVLGENARHKKPDIALAAIKLFEEAGLSFTVLADEPFVGGAMYDLVGEVEEVKKVAESFAAAVMKTKASKIVAIDPTDARMLKQEYPKWGISLPEVETGTAFFARLLKDGDLKVTKKLGKKVTLHDPCRLARDLEETEPARDIITMIGGELSEMYLNKNNTRCCGGEVLNAHSPETAKIIAQNRIADAKRTGGEMMVTACPACADRFGEVGGEYVCDLILLLADACGVV